MSNVVTMQGTRFLTPKLLFEELAQRDDIRSVALVVTRNDDFNEVLWSRQNIVELNMKAAVLNQSVVPLVLGTVDDE